MTAFVVIALLGWPVLVTVLYLIAPDRRTVAFGIVGGWLLLPPSSLVFSGLPDYSKISASVIGILGATVLLAPERLLRLRPGWIDLPMAVWCLLPFATYASNGLLLYSAMSDALEQSIFWGAPYLIGRLYFEKLEDLRYFARAIVIGGLAYVPPCLIEIRLSPQLQAMVYGQGSWQGTRMGGYRPYVFFGSGLELGLWMTAASLTGWWLWRTGVIRRMGNWPFGLLLSGLLVTTVLCRSTGALILLIIGMAAIWLTTRLRTRMVLVGLLLIGPIFVVLRTTGAWSGAEAVALANATVGPERAESLEFRYKCEKKQIAHALNRPLLGWGGFGRYFVYFDEDPTKVMPPDGLWIVALGSKGLIGLISLYLAIILPAARAVRLVPPQSWSDPRLAGALIGVVLLGIYIVDCLVNGFINIIYMTMCGGLARLSAQEFLSGGRTGDLSRSREGSTTRAQARRPGALANESAGGPARLAEQCRLLGRSYRREGRADEADTAWSQALDWLTAAIAADPSADALRRAWCDCANDLAWLRANRPEASRREPGSAITLASRTVEEYPEVAAYWNTLAAARYRAGDPEGALAAVGRSRSLAGGTAFDEVFQAMALGRSGQTEAGREALARALLLAERDHPGHAELAALCDEAQALLAVGEPASAG